VALAVIDQQGRTAFTNVIGFHTGFDLCGRNRNFMPVFRLLLPLLLIGLSLPAHAQGCSDAGFCTMGAMRPDQPFHRNNKFHLSAMEISFYRGTTTLSPVVYVATADLNFSINARNSVQLKLPYQWVSGRLAETEGVGDWSLCYTHNLLRTDRFDLSYSVGAKIPTNASDKSVNQLPLPMYYQTSLGTHDLVGGLSLLSRKWLFATGIQAPFGKNGNRFVWSAWDGTEEEAYVDRYHQARDLRRGIDIMLRVERNFRLSRWNFSAGLLPIYRISRDAFTNSRGQRVVARETTGLALSGIVTAGYSFNVKSSVRLLLGHKIMLRPLNPDGLTREFVSSVSYVYRFSI
jgi:hypothetical protein